MPLAANGRRAAREEGGDVAVFDRDTFYVWLMAPEVAQAAIARNRGGI